MSKSEIVLKKLLFVHNNLIVDQLINVIVQFTKYCGIELEKFYYKLEKETNNTKNFKLFIKL